MDGKTVKHAARPTLTVSIAVSALLLASFGCGRSAAQPAQTELDAMLERFWAATSTVEAASTSTEISESGAPFPEVFQRLKTGRTYHPGAPTGRVLRERTSSAGLRHPYMILVPEDYAPDRRWPVRINLHGGMGAPEWERTDGSWAGGWTRAVGQILVFPAGWWDSMWWEQSQVENIEAILSEVRRTWNIDENRVLLYGNSDGAAALFFYAMRAPDRFSAYVGHVGPPDRLVRADLRPDGQMHVPNLAGQRFHLGYGEADPLVPFDHLSRYMKLFEQAGAELDWYSLPGQGHSLTLLPAHEERFVRFIRESRREIFPDTLVWATERVDRYARRSWIVIDSLSASSPPPDSSAEILPRWGTAVQLRGPTTARRPRGKISAIRAGNRIDLQTDGVREMRILVSPDHIDLEQPVIVRVNGERIFNGFVEPSVRTLLRWARIDDDRTMLFAAELVVRIDDRGASLQQPA